MNLLCSQWRFFTQNQRQAGWCRARDNTVSSCRSWKQFNWKLGAALKSTFESLGTKQLFRAGWFWSQSGKRNTSPSEHPSSPPPSRPFHAALAGTWSLDVPHSRSWRLCLGLYKIFYYIRNICCRLAHACSFRYNSERKKTEKYKKQAERSFSFHWQYGYYVNFSKGWFSSKNGGAC